MFEPAVDVELLSGCSWVERLDALEQQAQQLQEREAAGRLSLQARVDLSAKAFEMLALAFGDPAVVGASCRASSGLNQPVLVATDLPGQLERLLALKSACWSEARDVRAPMVGDLVAPDDWPDGGDLAPGDAADPEPEAPPAPLPDPEAEHEPTHEPEAAPAPEPLPAPPAPLPDPEAGDGEVDLPAAWAMADPVEPQQQSELLAPELAAWFGRSISWVHAQIRAGVLVRGIHYERRGRPLVFNRYATFDALKVAGHEIPTAPLSTVEAIKSPPQPPEGWLSVGEVCDRLGLELKQLRNWSRCGIIPDCSEVLIGKARYYDQSVIAALENLRGR